MKEDELKERERKEVKISRCTKCGKEYIFDTFSHICPDCGKTLKVKTVLR